MSAKLINSVSRFGFLSTLSQCFTLCMHTRSQHTEVCTDCPHSNQNDVCADLCTLNRAHASFKAVAQGQELRVCHKQH